MSEGGPPFFISTSRMKTDNVLLTVLRHSGNVNSSYHYGEPKTETGRCAGVGVGGGRDREDATTISTLQTDKRGVGWGGGVDIRQTAGAAHQLTEW